VTESTGSGTETTITTEYLAMRFDHLIELLKDCLGVTGDSGDILPDGNKSLYLIFVGVIFFSASWTAFRAVRTTSWTAFRAVRTAAS
jgi:hypothetical protein